MGREAGLGPAPHPALPAPQAAPGLLSSPLLAAGGTAADLCPHLSLHHFPFAVSLAKATSLGLLFVCFFFLCTQHFLRLLTPGPVPGDAGT